LWRPGRFILTLLEFDFPALRFSAGSLRDPAEKRRYEKIKCALLPIRRAGHEQIP
jgi:hypothetical protein